MPGTLTDDDRQRIDDAVSRFADSRVLFQNVATSLMNCLANDSRLADFIHFIKYRVKDEESLRAKLERLTLEARDGQQVGAVDASNLFGRITDLAGLRIIHLHTEQYIQMHPLILEILNEQRYTLAGQPTAYCWDVEYADLFRSAGVEIKQRASMYTTVHYDVVVNQKTGIACELQVRSLVDEVWGEVSHRVNYPTTSPSETCQDQLKVLARLTSGCGRLVDSIFKTHGDAIRQRPLNH